MKYPPQALLEDAAAKERNLGIQHIVKHVQASGTAQKSFNVAERLKIKEGSHPLSYLLGLLQKASIPHLHLSRPRPEASGDLALRCGWPSP